MLSWTPAQPPSAPAQTGRAGALALWLLRALRDGWLILGTTLALFLGLEVAFQALWHLRHPPPPDWARLPDHPYAGQPWWLEFWPEQGRLVRRSEFDPYRGWRSPPMATPYINIDSAGRRRTRPAPVAVRWRIYALGGSAMWGYGARDDYTVPSLLAGELERRGYRGVEVTNLARIGYNSTQETITALLEALHGRVPDAVVVLDGFNDIETTFQRGEPGHAYAEARAQERLRLGQQGFWEELVDLGRHSTLIQWLRGRIQPEARPRRAAWDPELCQQTAEYYSRAMDALGTLGQRFGFRTLVFQQSMDVTSNKVRTPWEQRFARLPATQEHWRQCAGLLDSAMARESTVTYRSLRTLFDAHRETVFVDPTSHITEAANAVVAAAIADALVPILPPAMRPSHPARGRRPGVLRASSARRRPEGPRRPPGT